MLEDGLKDVESLMDPEKEIQRDAMKLAVVTSDNIGTNYLKIINSVSFSDLSIYTVEHLVLEHGRRPWMEDNLGWKMTLDGRRPWMEDNLGLKTKLY